ncbi:MAG TPA: hypothetical protein VIE66_04520 [Methylocella sp.]|jgi:hypothetical protein
MITRFTTFVILALVLLPIKNALAQAADTPWQIGVVNEDLTKIDTTVAVSNSGASSTIASPQNGAICVNVYATSAPLSSIVACCTCRVQANALRAFSVGKEVLVSVLPKARTSVIKLLASTGTAGACNASTAGIGANVLVTGMLSWLVPATSNSVAAVGKTSLNPATLSAAELVSVTSQCAVLPNRACNSTCSGP